MNTNVIILATALLPSTGHADLIKFAANLPGRNIKVLINGRSSEPYPPHQRLLDLRSHFESYPNIEIRLSVNDLAPQNPEDHEDFWNWWKKEINTAYPEVRNNWELVVASEPYGIKLAETLNAEFLPYDIERHNNKIKSTDIRKNIWENWSYILPESKTFLQYKVTLFGQESVGKTTMSKLLAETYKVNWLQEYARPLLETIGPELTPRKMEFVHIGQTSTQQLAYRKAEHPIIFQDTDLFSTVGYYKIGGFTPHKTLIEDALRLKSDLYIVLADNIPFEEDELRYGGNVRESSMGFWIKILEDNNLNYVIITEPDLQKRLQNIQKIIDQKYGEHVEDLAKFQRD